MHGHRAFLKGMRIVGLSILGLVTFGMIGLIFGLLVQLLWNWLMPDIFRLPEITYWQAFGIVILGKLILGNFAPHPGHYRHHHGHPFPEHFARHHQHYFHPGRGCGDTEWQVKGGWQRGVRRPDGPGHRHYEGAHRPEQDSFPQLHRLDPFVDVERDNRRLSRERLGSLRMVRRR